MPTHLAKHFIRGYIDGDGCIYYDKKRNNWRLQITSNRYFLEGINEHFQNTFNIKACWSKCHRNGNNESYNLIINGKVNVAKILSYLYKDSIISLQRKAQLSFRCIKACEEKENI